MEKWNNKTDDEKVGSAVTLWEDGVYRWRYDLNLYTNPMIFLLVWKIFFFIILGIFVIAMIADAVQWSDFFPDRLLVNLKFFGYITGGMTVLTVIGCLIYAAIMGGKYCVIFEMDDQGINHRQIEFQAEKARKLATVTSLAGVASKNITTVGVGMNASRTEMYSQFDVVKKIIAYPNRHLIKVNGVLDHNQVYVRPEDFEFVHDYIVKHCPQAKRK